MSLHKSLRSHDTLQRLRNVFTRIERLKILREKGLWQDGASVFGLPKVKTRVKVKKRKVIPEGVEAAEGAEASTEAAAESED